MALDLFGIVGTHDDLPMVKEMFKDPDPHVRSAAISLFGIVGNHDDLPTVRGMIKDPNLSIRSGALSAFEKLANEDDFIYIVKKYSNGESFNKETLKCIISLDEKFFSPKNEVLSLHKKGHIIIQKATF